MIMRPSFFRPLSLIVAAILLLLQAPSAHSRTRVAFLPFESNTAKNLDFLSSGIRDMLASRLASKAEIEVVDKGTVDKALAQVGSLDQPQHYERLGQQLQARYLVTGSLTALGSSLSLDARVYKVPGERSPQSFYATAAGENDIIPAIDRLAGEIGVKVFGIAPPAAAAGQAGAPIAPAPAPAYQTAHPDRIFMGRAGTGSPFLRPMGVSGALGFTKSQNLRLGLRAMDTGDIDGDGKQEFVLAGPNQVAIYRREQGRFVKIGQASTLTRYVIHSVSVADLNKNGRAEIYVSAADPGEPSSMALEWDGKQFAPIFDKQRWYIRALNLPGEGMVLLGQQAGIDSFLEPGVFRLILDGQKNLVKDGALGLPRDIHLFDFSFVDVDRDEKSEIVAITQEDKLAVYTQSGKLLWKSDEYYGGTTRYLGGLDMEKIDSYRNNAPDIRHYVPARIAAMDINRDGQMDIVVVRNISAASRLFANTRVFPSGEIHAMTWNGIGMTELWRTRKIDGYIADFQLGPEVDIPAGARGGAPGRGAELFVGVVLRSSGLNILAASESTVLIYQINQADAASDSSLDSKGNASLK